MKAIYRQFLPAIVASTTFFSVGMLIQILWRNSFERIHDPFWIKTEMLWLAALGPFIFLFVGKYLIDGLGRKYSIMLSAVPIIISTLMMATKDYKIQLVAAMVAGFGFSLPAVALPIYIGEISEAKNRGKLNFFAYFLFFIGLHYESIVGQYLGPFLFNVARIGLMIFIVVLTSIIPESPYFYLKKGRVSDAEASLRKLRGKFNVSSELALLQEGNYVESGFKELFKNPGDRRAFFIILFLGLYPLYGHHLMSNMILELLASENMRNFGFSKLMYLYVFCVFLSGVIFYHLVDRLGRRFIFLLSSGIKIVCILTMGIMTFLMRAEISNTGLLIFLSNTAVFVSSVISTSTSWSLISVLMSEYFPTSIKTSTNYAIIVLLSLGELATQEFFIRNVNIISGLSMILIASIPLIVGTIIMYFVMPETKGRALMDVERMLTTKTSRNHR